MDKLVCNQETIANSVTGCIKKSEFMTQSQLLRECKVALKKVQHAVCTRTVEVTDPLPDKAVSLFPLQSVTMVSDVEERLESPEFAQAMKTYLHKAKGSSEDIKTVVRQYLTDYALDNYNWPGVNEKKLIAALLRDVYPPKDPRSSKKQ